MQTILTYPDLSRVFELQPMKGPYPNELRSLIDEVTSIYESLLTVGDDTKITNALLIHIIMSKVDSKTRSNWEEKLEYQSIPSWIDCISALNKHYHHLSA